VVSPSGSEGTSGTPRPAAATAALAEQVAGALRTADFDPQNAGGLFLRAAAQRAIRAAIDPAVAVAVAGSDDPQARGVTFMGARFSPDLVVQPAAGRPLAVTLTLLRGDASAIPLALSNALVLTVRFDAVVAFVLDRRLAKRNPFDDPDTEPEVRTTTDAERRFLEELWRGHRVLVEVRRQDPFGWG
jgi:hypothetical protein